MSNCWIQRFRSFKLKFPISDVLRSTNLLCLRQQLQSPCLDSLAAVALQHEMKRVVAKALDINLWRLDGLRTRHLPLHGLFHPFVQLLKLHHELLARRFTSLAQCGHIHANCAVAQNDGPLHNRRVRRMI